MLARHTCTHRWIPVWACWFVRRFQYMPGASTRLPSVCGVLLAIRIKPFGTLSQKPYTRAANQTAKPPKTDISLSPPRNIGGSAYYTTCNTTSWLKKRGTCYVRRDLCELRLPRLSYISHRREWECVCVCRVRIYRSCSARISPVEISLLVWYQCECGYHFLWFRQRLRNFSMFHS